jgi:molybdate transport system substrate-binding protein
MRTETSSRLIVSAAMSLRQVMVDIGRAFEHEGHGPVAFNFGASNSLARQIIEGSPVDVFVSADEAQMQLAEQAGVIAGDTRVDLLSNQLVVVVPADRAVHLSSVRELAGAAFPRIAFGDPDAVPVGVYARRYLESLGLWQAIQPKIVPVVSVRSAVGAVENGGVDAAFVYRTDAALSSKVAVAYAVPIDQGPVIRYPAAVVRTSRQPEAARQFLLYLQGPEARATFERGGFIPLTGGQGSS